MNKPQKLFILILFLLSLLIIVPCAISGIQSGFNILGAKLFYLVGIPLLITPTIVVIFFKHRKSKVNDKDGK